MKIELYNSLHSLIFYKKDSMLCALHYKRCLPGRPAQIYTGTGNKQVQTPLSHSSEVRGPHTKHVIENFCCSCKLIKAFIGFIPVGILSDQRASSWENNMSMLYFTACRDVTEVGGLCACAESGRTRQNHSWECWRQRWQMKHPTPSPQAGRDTWTSSRTTGVAFIADLMVCLISF